MIRTLGCSVNFLFCLGSKYIPDWVWQLISLSVYQLDGQRLISEQREGCVRAGRNETGKMADIAVFQDQWL